MATQRPRSWTIAAMNLNDLVLFAHAAEDGGFAPAARRHGVPKSTFRNWAATSTSTRARR
jgi:hypothetical protein